MCKILNARWKQKIILSTSLQSLDECENFLTNFGNNLSSLMSYSLLSYLHFFVICYFCLFSGILMPNRVIDWLVIVITPRLTDHWSLIKLFTKNLAKRFVKSNECVFIFKQLSTLSKRLICYHLALKNLSNLQFFHVRITLHSVFVSS